MDLTITSPDDWPDSWRELRDIDSLLRCSICCEFMETAMTLSKCSHSYCSLCIRQSICYKTQCPTCFVAAVENDLVNNRSLNEVIQKFTIVRKRLLESLLATCNNASKIKDDSKTDPPKSSTTLKSYLSEKPTIKASSHSEEVSLKEVQNNGGKTSSKNDQHPLQKKKPRLRKAKAKSYAESEDSAKSSDGSDSDGSDSDVMLCDLTNDIDTSDEDFKPETFTPKTLRKKRKKSSKSPPKMTSRQQHFENERTNTEVDRSSESKASDDMKDIVTLDTLTLPKLSLDSCSTPKSVRETGTNNDGPKVALLSPAFRPSTSFSLHSPSTSNPVASGSSSLGASSPGSNVKGITRVPCPVCGVEVPDKHINLHLDRCLSGKAPREAKPPPPKRKQMPKLVYNLLKDKDLKKKCAEVGLNTDGDRKTLIKRHHDFTLQYNAQCDSENPKSATELVKQIQKMEQAKSKGLILTKSTSQQKLMIHKNASSEEVRSAQQVYSKQHKSQFEQLVEEARQRRLLKKQLMENKSADSDKGQEENVQDTTTTSAAVASYKPTLSSSSLVESDVEHTDQPNPEIHCQTRTEDEPNSLPEVSTPHLPSFPKVDNVSAENQNRKVCPGLPNLDFNSNLGSGAGSIEETGVGVTEQSAAAGLTMEESSNSERGESSRNRVTEIEETTPEVSFFLGSLGSSDNECDFQGFDDTEQPNEPGPDNRIASQSVPTEAQNSNANNANDSNVLDDNDDTEPLSDSYLQLSKDEQSDSEIFSSPESPSLLLAPSKSYIEDMGFGLNEGSSDAGAPSGVIANHQIQNDSPLIPNEIVADTVIDGENVTGQDHGTIDNELRDESDLIPKERGMADIPTEAENLSGHRSDVCDVKSDLGDLDNGAVVEKKRRGRPKKLQPRKSLKEVSVEDTLLKTEEHESGLPGSSSTVLVSSGDCEFESASTCTSASHTSDLLFPGSPIPENLPGEELLDTRRRSSRQKRPRNMEEEPLRASKRTRKGASRVPVEDANLQSHSSGIITNVNENVLENDSGSNVGKRKPRARKK